jgi:nitrogen-specific signal transduction histidine kinase
LEKGEWGVSRERGSSGLKLIILITGQESALRTITNFIPEDYLLLEGTVDKKGLQMLVEIASGVVLVDSSIPGVLSWVEEARRLRPDLTYLGLADTADDALFLAGAEYFYDLILAPFKAQNVRMVLERTLERERLRWEVENFNKMHTAASAPANKPVSANQAYPARYNRERVLCEFSRALNNNFDQNRFLELFMNAVVELVPVGKLSILLYEESLAEYKIAAQRGLDPDLCAGLRFKPSADLLLWLAREGRILHPGEISTAPAAPFSGISGEMQLLQAAVCIPLLAHGQLVGTLNLGPKFTGSPFFEEELETLYIFCGNVAVALRDIELHHEIRNQKLFTENILQHMNSGVIAINKEECINTFNPRAGELLALKPQQVIGKDLRLLPSPLGDLLYETLTTGAALRKKEIELAYGRIHLEINTYRLLNAVGEPLGSVMIFDDLSPRKLLEKERRQAAQLDVLNKFVGQLAHEVKNPMVAVQTFTELLPEKYDDSSFREFYAKTVRQELKRLNELVEQLIAFSTPLSYDYSIVDLQEIINLGISFLQEQGMDQKTTVETADDLHSLKVRADRTLLARAFSYLLRYLFRAVEDGGVIQITTAVVEKYYPGGSAYILLRDSQTKAVPESVEKMFDPLAAHPNGYISLGPPVSRKIIEDHGGRVTASLTKDHYLEIEVFLPIFSGKEG